MADFIAWSHSRLKTFKDCPKQFYHCNIPRKGHPDRIDFEQSQAMLDGNEVDAALTARISQGTRLPPKFSPFEKMALVILNTPGQKLTQMKIALNQAFQQCGYMDWDRAWVRTVYDVAVVQDEYAFIGDWKNGQIWLDSDQLKLFATVGFTIFPQVQKIDTSYIWLKHGVTSDETFYRRELPDLWAHFVPDVERLQAAGRSNNWPTTPSKRACKWCPVNKRGLCKDAAVEFGGG